jgi:alcohol dehydrogenase class IV
MTFEFATAQRILFGTGRVADVPGLISALGRRPLLVCGSNPARVPSLVTAATVGCWPVTGEPTFAGARAALAFARGLEADAVVAVGGGSVIDSAKALAMLLANGGDPLDYAEVIGAGRPITLPSRPLVAVPTTAGAGSEATRNAVLRDPERGLKVSLRSPFMLPAVAVVDPDLTRDLSPALTAATGMDALSQLIEPFLCCRANPMTDALCRDGLPRVARALPRAFRHGDDSDARADMALGALLGGMALANAGLGAVHGFAAVLGGAFTASHGAVCAALLAPVLEMNGRVLPETGPAECCARLDELARLLTGRQVATITDAVAWVRQLTSELGIPGLRAYGVTAADIPEICRQAAQASSMKANPVKLSDGRLREILAQAL